MTIDRRTLLAAAAAALPATALRGQVTADRRPIWPGKPPSATATMPRFRREERPLPGRSETWLTGIAAPTLELFRPERPNGLGFVAIPGGGYEFLAYSNEGADPARVFASMGYTVAVLAYRLPAEGWARQADVPLQDAQRAMRLLRSQAQELGLTRIGVLGASAGGHLAASLATGYDEPLYQPVDAADRLSARPDFAGLLYPVATLELPQTHRGSREHLLGPSPSEAEVRRRSPTAHVTARTPPSFIVHSFDDDVVPIQCTFDWIAAARAAGTVVEAHLPQRGGHGYNVHLPPENPGSLWSQQFDRWIKQLLRG